jgi:hypothetical protein
MKQLLYLLLIILPFQVFSQELNHVKGELIVQFSKEINAHEISRKYAVDQNVEIYSFEQISKNVNVYQLTFVDKQLDLNKHIIGLYGYPGVINVQKNHFVTLRETIPNDTIFNDLWHLKNTGQSSGTVDADIDATDAWDVTTGGLSTHNDTIVVCIIESLGVDIYHVDLKDNIWHNYAEIPDDGIDNDNNGYIDDFDGWNVFSDDDQVGAGNHGTKVAGMIGSTGNNTTGMTGVNWDVKMMIIKGQVANNEASVIEAYDYPLTMRKIYNESYGQEGAFVVVTNASWGINGGTPADAPIWCAMYDSLGAEGILNVAATSNQNSDVDILGDLPTTCPSDYLIGVTMTNNTDVRANAGYGPINVDLAAPGSGVMLPIPGDFYSNSNGTSFAAPCVSGAIALAYSTPCAEFIHQAKVDPAGTALEMRNYILSSVDVIPSLVGEVATGGRLNVNNAIDSILTNCNVSACVPPYNLRAEAYLDTTTHLVWDGFSTNYLFYIQEGSGPIVQIPITALDTIYFDTLVPCTYYTTWVRGICGLDTSDYSTPYEFKTDGCCDNPLLILDDVSPDSMLISWNPTLYATEYDFRYRKDGDATWITTLVDTVSPIQLTGLDSCSIYEFQIKTLCTDSTQGYSSSQFFTTLGCGACYEAEYCEVIGANVSSEWINSVVVGTYYSTTGSDDGWLQTENLMGGFIPGQSYNISLEPGYSGFAFTEHFSVWVDFDQNGVFDVTDLVINDQTTSSVLNSTINIPINAQHGYTKMRIGMNGETAPENCPTAAFYGEYEDYCVYIGQDASVPTNENRFTIYPNPASSSIIIQSEQSIHNITIYSQDGKVVLKQVFMDSVLDISNLTPGFYLISVETDEGTSVQKFIKQ